ncbi:DUF2590 family protein [Pseudoalteromonas sp. S558]|uniref:DUF2590 family protein n=1 Tax=Pseudoalteromonas sp. S558 TaxID=2066515 RepID=UPI00110BDF74|nr:DUF2590 family protein [Pseudoalteromonas sp. S558]TMO02931.1 hypothetical protein CWB66_12400 [Pseudoalteromonas sp. S558]
MATINIDLNIIDNDIALDGFAVPSQLTNSDVIAQDVKHRIIESRKLTELIGLRNKNIVAKVLTEIELIVEQDERLIPGTIKVIKQLTGEISVTAHTIEGAI